MKIKDIKLGTKVIHITEKKPMKVVALHEGVAIATKKLFGTERYVVLDFNKNICGHSVLMNFPRGVEGCEDYHQELIQYGKGDWEISNRGIGQLDKYFKLWEAE